MITSKEAYEAAGDRKACRLPHCKMHDAEPPEGEAPF